MEKIVTCSVEVDMVGEINGQFSPTKFHLSLLGSLASCGRGGTWRRKLERSKLWGRGDSGLHNKPADCDASEAYTSGLGSEEECWQFVFQNVNLNVTCKPLYASAMQPAKSYRQAQSSNFKVS
jgi:hypothetical protein